MNARDLPGLSALRPYDVQQHLMNEGWQLLHVRDDVARYAPPDESRGRTIVELLLDTTYADYLPRMAELVDAVAAWERRSALQVLDDLLSPPSDVWRFRFIAPAIDGGFMPIDDAIRIRLASRQLLLSAAHAAIESRAHYPRMTLSAATDLLSRCREGQTERGSYISRLLVPVPPEVGPRHLPAGDAPPEDPYARRVSLTLMSALTGVAEAVQTGATEKLLGLVDRGVSANLLAALAEIAPKMPGTTVELSVAWSRSRRPPPATRKLVSFHEGFFPLFGEAARELRNSSQSPNTSIEGYVIRLESANLDGPGRMVVATKLEGRQALTPVTVGVTSTDYARAIEAHRAGSRVKVVGTLRKLGRGWSLDQPTPFELVGESVVDEDVMNGDE
jgi:hypothetical protein